MIVVTLVLSAVAQAHFIVFVIDEMTTALNIRVFRVKPVSYCFNEVQKVEARQLNGGLQVTADAVAIEMPEIGAGRYSQGSSAPAYNPKSYGVLE